MPKNKVYMHFLRLIEDLDSAPPGEELTLEVTGKDGRVIRIAVTALDENSNRLYLCKEEGDD